LPSNYFSSIYFEKYWKIPLGAFQSVCYGTHSFGAVAQLGERLPCTQEVIGSIPFGSTISTPISLFLSFHQTGGTANAVRRIVDK
jgi:hypothetical protein